MGRHAVKARQDAAKVKRKARLNDNQNLRVGSTERSVILRQNLGFRTTTKAPDRHAIHSTYPQAAVAEGNDLSRSPTERVAPVPASERADSHMQVVSDASEARVQAPACPVGATRPARQASKAVRTLLQQIRMDDARYADSEEDELGVTTAVEESQAEAEFADDDDADENPYEEEFIDINEEDEAVPKKHAPKVAQATKKPKTIPRTVEDVSGEETSDDEDFRFTLEILSRDKNYRDLHTVASSITLHDLRQKIASSLNIYAENLEVYYRFSVDTNNTPPCALTTHVQLGTVMRLLRPYYVPAVPKSGKPSKRALKACTLQVFNKGDSPFGPSEAKGGGGSTKAKGPSPEQTKSVLFNEVFSEGCAAARRAITKFWACDIHSLPDKPSLCFKNKLTGLCHPITENNLNFWAALHVKDPEQNPITQPPPEINVLGNVARGRPATKPSANMNETIGFPYACYPPPFMTPAMYFGGMGFPQVYPAFGQPQAGMPAPVGFGMNQNQGPTAPVATAQPMKYPDLSEWIQFCDWHPNHSGDNLVALIPKIKAKGFLFLNQLTRVGIDKLCEWLEISPGTADLIVGYASEDCQLIAAGRFTMDGATAATEA